MNPRARLWSIGAGLVVFLGVSPAVLGHFGFADDYTFLYLAQTDPAEIDRTFIGGGRPLGGAMYRVLFAAIGTIDRLGYVRFICAVGSASLAIVLTRLALKYGYRPALSFLLGAGLVTLPCIIVSGTWASQMIGSLTALISLGAGAVLVETQERFARRTLVGILLLAIAICLYQPAAMEFWAVWLLWVLSPATRRTATSTVLRVSGAFLLAMGATSVLGLVVHRIGARLAHWTGPRSALTTDVPGKLWHVVTMVWPRVANPWGIHPPMAVAAGMTAAVLLGMLTLPSMTLGRRVLRVVAIIATLVLGYAPNLASSETWISSRSMIGILLVLPICLASLIEEACDRLKPRELPLAPLAISVSILGCAWTASFVYANVVVPQEEELLYARPAILEASKAPSLAVVPSSWTESFATSVDHDEIGLPSTSQSWVLVPLTELVYREAHGEWYGHAQLRTRAETAPVTEAAVLDFAQVLDPKKRNRE